MNEPVQRQQIGYDLAGNPMYAAPLGVTGSRNPIEQGQQPAPLQPIKVHPWGAYLAGGCLGLLALTVAVVLVMFVVFGFAILAAVLAVVVVSLVICLLILRDVWRSSRKG